MSTSSSNFFLTLPSFNKFEELTEAKHYRPAPADWFLVLTDVEGSTKAIEEGRYRDINTLGAASITCVYNLLKGVSFPFVFGGDGATFLIPSEWITAVKDKLHDLKSHSKQALGLDLRVGTMSVRELIDAGQTVEVAKFQLHPRKSIALIRGGGLSWAEARIKNEPKAYCLSTESQKTGVELTGLSCRWQPIHSRRGKILSLLIAPTDLQKSEATLKEVMEVFMRVFDRDLERANPIHTLNIEYKSLGQCIKDEKWFHFGEWGLNYFYRLLEIFLCVWVFRLKLFSPFNAKAYLESIPTHSDYRKLDDTLRMTLDCSIPQAQRIADELEQLHQRGSIFFGIHESDSALMTCFVENLNEGGHIHFIDGSGGGYALAAKKLKQQMGKK